MKSIPVNRLRLSADTGAVGLAAGGESDACWVFNRAFGTAGEVAGNTAAGDSDRSGSEGREGEDGEDAGELHFDGVGEVERGYV